MLNTWQDNILVFNTNTSRLGISSSLTIQAGIDTAKQQFVPNAGISF